MVELFRVTKSFGGQPIVRDLSLQVQAGEFLTLLGPSGCGKTTSLRMIAGFETPDTGRVLIDGVDVTDLPPFRRDVNTVFQSYALFPHLTVLENVGFGLRNKGVRGSEALKRAREALRLVQLEGLEGRKPRQLSGGQQQRVAVARALVMEPQVLLLDEPLGALDLKLRKEMQLELKRLQSRLGITFIYVTHDQEEALTMSDRIAVMEAGEIRQLGRPTEIYDRPATRFVASFVGETNLLSGRVVMAGSAPVVAIGDMRVWADGAAPLDQDVYLSVRPEHVSVRSGVTQASGPNAFSGQVTDLIYAGPVLKAVIRLAAGPHLVALASPDSGSIRPGDPVTVTWEPRHTVVMSA